MELLAPFRSFCKFMFCCKATCSSVMKWWGRRGLELPDAKNCLWGALEEAVLPLWWCTTRHSDDLAFTLGFGQEAGMWELPHPSAAWKKPPKASLLLFHLMQSPYTLSGGSSWERGEADSRRQGKDDSFLAAKTGLGHLGKMGRRLTLSACSTPSLLPSTQQWCSPCSRGSKLRWGLTLSGTRTARL